MAPYSAHVTLDRGADLVILSKDRESPEKPVELAREAVRLADFEAESIARPDKIINPVDLGAILVPSGWLLLGPGQTATLETAAISRNRDWSRARVTVRFESAPGVASSAAMPLASSERATVALRLPQAPLRRDRDVLSVVIDDGDGRELWRKTIPVMIVSEPPRWLRFAAGYEKLRFDAPISVRDPKTGKYSSLRYDDAWDRSLRDIVVWLPNGTRFVFWRGSSYIPFWAGRHNTGLCYEWARNHLAAQGAGRLRSSR